MIRKNSLAYFILLSLEKSIQAGVLLTDFAYNSHELLYRYPGDINYGGLYQAIRDLREKGFLETEKDGKKLLIKLTDRGRQEAILKKLLANEEWDGKWRIVIFDIPEKHRKLRDVLRSKLREWEFVPWQKSVWAGKKDVTGHLRIFIEEVGLSDWVRVVVSVDVN